MSGKRRNPKQYFQIGDTIPGTSWRAVGPTYRNARSCEVIPCECSCGSRRDVMAVHLLRGESRQCRACGHVNRRPPHRHGIEGTRSSFHAMHARVRLRRSYIDAGITVCERWTGPDGFERFRADMGRDRPRGMTVERIDNTKGYAPSNTRWAPMSEQNRNRRNNRKITARGIEATVTDHARLAGIQTGTLIKRLDRGMSPDAAVCSPVKPYKRRNHRGSESCRPCRGTGVRDHVTCKACSGVGTLVIGPKGGVRPMAAADLARLPREAPTTPNAASMPGLASTRPGRRCVACHGVGVSVAIEGKNITRSRCATCEGVGLVITEGTSARPFRVEDIVNAPVDERGRLMAGFMAYGLG